MRLIEDFYCIQNEGYGNGSEKIISESICKIKTELIRPEIFLLSDGNKVPFKSHFDKTLKENPFSQEDLLFFEKHYNVTLRSNVISKTLASDNSAVHKLYDLPANILLFENTELNKSFLLIEFRRWQFDYQPRGAGEDSLGEDILFVHGIWENPLLTNEIIAKIKNIS